MYTQEQIRDHPDPVVFPLKVISFMRYGDLFAFRLEVERDIDHGSDQSHKKRRFDISLVIYRLSKGLKTLASFLSVCRIQLRVSEGTGHLRPI